MRDYKSLKWAKQNNMWPVYNYVDSKARDEAKRERGKNLGPRKYWENLISERIYNFQEAYAIFCEIFPTYKDEKCKNMLLNWAFELDEKNKKEKDVDGPEK